MNRILDIPNKNINVDELPGNVLAYLGDAVFELYVTTKVVLEKYRKLDELNSEAHKFVKASEQAAAFKNIESILTEDEITIYKRGRNGGGNISSRSASVVDYRMATGLEALTGYLYLTKQFDRLDEIMELILNKGE